MYMYKLFIGHFVAGFNPTIEDFFRKECDIDGVPVLLEILDTGGLDVRKL